MNSTISRIQLQTLQVAAYQNLTVSKFIKESILNAELAAMSGKTQTNLMFINEVNYTKENMEQLIRETFPGCKFECTPDWRSWGNNLPVKYMITVYW